VAAMLGGTDACTRDKNSWNGDVVDDVGVGEVLRALASRGPSESLPTSPLDLFSGSVGESLSAAGLSVFSSDALAVVGAAVLDDAADVLACSVMRVSSRCACVTTDPKPLFAVSSAIALFRKVC
jgi:hypothetical protein